MQSTFVVAIQTDIAPPVDRGARTSDAHWPALASSLELAAVGALAGATLCALDYARMALSSLSFQLTWPEHLAHVTLMFLAGYLAGLLGALALHACVELGRWAAARWQVSPRLAISLVLATACLVVIVPVAVALFQGRGIRQTHFARWGPWVVSVTGWVLCGVVAWAVQKLHSSLEAANGAPGRRVLSGAAAAVMFGPLVYCDLYLFYGLYDYLHAALMALGFVVVSVALCVVLRVFAPGRQRGQLASLGAAVAALCLPVFAYSSTRYDAGLGDFATHLAYTGRVITLARQVTDWDHDGYSHILGHEDAAILDGRIKPLAVEVPDNGTDEDGVFGDLSQAGLDAARQKHARGQSDEARAQYRALQHRAALHGAQSGAVTPPNLLLITIDTLRADRVLPDREGDPRSFAAFKKGSVRFERAFASSSYTRASVTMMMTGRYDAEPPTTSLFSALREAGCTTLLAFAETPYKILDDSQPNVVGSFDQRVVVPDREPGDLAVFHSYVATRPTSEKIVANALRLLEANRERRTCTWVYLFDAHQWQQLRDPDVVGNTSSMEPARYDSAVAYTLKQVSYLLDGLERLGLADNTAVVLSGDHGEGLGEKGVVGHTRRVHNPLLHVPLIIRAPGLDPRIVGKTEVGLIDLAPTILDLLDFERGLPNVDGASLLPLMLGQADEQHVVFTREAEYQAVFESNYKLVLDRLEGRYRLYDLVNDYAEERSLFELPGYEDIARDLYYSYQAGGIGPWGSVPRPPEIPSLTN